MKGQRLNDKERTLWVENDESLYRWWKSTDMTLRRFVRKHRADIDLHIKERTCHHDQSQPV